MATFGPFESRPEIAVALSGGVDSLTLLKLSLDWTRRRGGRVRAFIVDHDLRNNSSQEAISVAQKAKQLGAKTSILRWRHPKLESRIQECARKARYELLIQACLEANILHLLLGHQADDQTETIIMRAERQSGSRGLAGMSSIIEYPHGRILRPLLCWPKAKIVATAKFYELDWVDDPTNTNPRFWRGAYRQNLPTSREPENAQANRQHKEQAEAIKLADIVISSPLGYLCWPASEHEHNMLTQIAATIGGRQYRPQIKEKFSDWQTITISGSIICRRGHYCYALREPARMQEAINILKGQIKTWDSRFVIDNREGQSSIIAKPRTHETQYRLNVGEPARPATVRAAIPILLNEDLASPQTNHKLSETVHFGATIPLTNAPFAT